MCFLRQSRDGVKNAARLDLTVIIGENRIVAHLFTSMYIVSRIPRRRLWYHDNFVRKALVGRPIYVCSTPARMHVLKYEQALPFSLINTTSLQYIQLGRPAGVPTFENVVMAVVHKFWTLRFKRFKTGAKNENVPRTVDTIGWLRLQ